VSEEHESRVKFEKECSVYKAKVDVLTKAEVEANKKFETLENKYGQLKKSSLEERKAHIKEKADAQIDSLQSQLNAAKGGRVALLVFSAITTPIVIGAAGIMGSELGIVPQIESLKERIWVLEHYPESVRDKELKQRAASAINIYNDKMKRAEAEENRWYSDWCDGPTNHFSEKSLYWKEQHFLKAASIRSKANTKLEATKETLNAYVQNKFYS
jgi:hypothetical protein